MPLNKELLAWLIERRDTQSPGWLTWYGGGWGWTTNANDAIKFADEQSAKAIQATQKYTFPTFVCEHSWPDGL